MNEVKPALTQQPLGALFERLVQGGTPSTAESAYWDGHVPWVTGADFTSRGIGEIRRYVSDLGVRSSSTSIIEAGNILLVTRTGVGKLAIAKEPIAISQDITGVYFDRGKVDVLYAYYMLLVELDSLKKLNQGTSINGLVRADLERHVVSLPTDINAQKKIARILQTIDQAIEKTEALIDKYQQFKAGLMHDLFTRGIGPNGQLRPPREQAPELYHETPIGWIPKDWGVCLLRACLFDNPGNGVYKPSHEIGNGTLMIGQTAFTKERSIDFGLCRRGEISVAEQKCFGVTENDILVTRVFATVEGVGLPVLVPSMPENAVFESNMMRLRVDEDRIRAALLFEWLQMPFARKLIVSGANASNQASVNQKLLCSLPVPTIGKIEQLGIFARTRAFLKRLNAEKRTLSKLQEQKSGLMHDLLTGKVSVRVRPEDYVETASA